MAGSNETVRMRNNDGAADRTVLAISAALAVIASAGILVSSMSVVFAIMDASDAGHRTGGGQAALAVGAPVIALLQLLAGIGLFVLWLRRSPRRKSTDRPRGTFLVQEILIVVTVLLSAALVVTQLVIDGREHAYDLGSVHVLQAWIVAPGAVLIAVGVWIAMLYRDSRRRS